MREGRGKDNKIPKKRVPRCVGKSFHFCCGCDLGEVDHHHRHLAPQDAVDPKGYFNSLQRYNHSRITSELPISQITLVMVKV